MRHEPLVLAVIPAEPRQLGGEGERLLEILEEAGEAGVEGVAHAVDHMGARQQEGGQAEPDEIAGHLVGDAPLLAAAAVDGVQIALGERLGLLPVEQRRGLGIGLARRNHLGQAHQALDHRIAGGQLA